MKLGFNVVAWQASAPGLSTKNEWINWAAGAAHIQPDAPLASCVNLPMMTARRLNSGSRLAVDCGLGLLSAHQADAVVFTSRHGELERNFKILQALARTESLSPTEFTMSVHNSAVGSLTIAAKTPLVSSSVSAGSDSFQQGLFEVRTLFASGLKQVLLVDFDGVIPDFYRPHILPEPVFPYAVALLLSNGNTIWCESQKTTQRVASALPQSLQFLHGWLSSRTSFPVQGERNHWHWSR